MSDLLFILLPLAVVGLALYIRPRFVEPRERQKRAEKYRQYKNRK